MIEISDLTVTLGRRSILSNVSLAAPLGQMLAICGPNGAGKSTLLRAITGELPFAGRIQMNGADIAKAKPWQLAQMRAVLAQDTQVAFDHSVAEIVGLGSAAGGQPASVDEIHRVLGEVGLGGFAGRALHSLSGGERQRAHLARALAQLGRAKAGKWLFLDEPVASLDIGHQLQVMSVAKAFAQAGGGVVVVLHDLNLAAMFADRIALLRGGTVLAQGTATDVLTPPLLTRAYGCRIAVGQAPKDGPWILPQMAELG